MNHSNRCCKSSQAQVVALGRATAIRLAKDFNHIVLVARQW